MKDILAKHTHTIETEAFGRSHTQHSQIQFKQQQPRSACSRLSAHEHIISLKVFLCDFCSGRCSYRFHYYLSFVIFISINFYFIFPAPTLFGKDFLSFSDHFNVSLMKLKKWMTIKRICPLVVHERIRVLHFVGAINLIHSVSCFCHRCEIEFVLLLRFSAKPWITRFAVRIWMRKAQKKFIKTLKKKRKRNWWCIAASFFSSHIRSHIDNDEEIVKCNVILKSKLKKQNSLFVHVFVDLVLFFLLFYYYFFISRWSFNCFHSTRFLRTRFARGQTQIFNDIDVLVINSHSFV